MATEETISQQIRRALAEVLKRDVESIHPHQSLRNDLGLNSVDTFELVFELEEAFHVDIPDQDFPKLTTVAAVIEYVEARITQANP